MLYSRETHIGCFKLKYKKWKRNNKTFLQQIIENVKCKESSQNIYPNPTENQAENMSAKPSTRKAIQPLMLSGWTSCVSRL